MTSEEIFMLTCGLREDPGLAQSLRRELQEIAASTAYRRWSSGLEQAQPFELPSTLENNYPSLTRSGLLRPLRRGDPHSVLRLKVNSVPLHHAQAPPTAGVFLTDGVWQPAGWRAFPFSDESQSLVNRALELRWHERCDLVLDLAAGVGHSALALPVSRSVSFDINPRALSLLELNKLLNQRDTKAHQAVLANLLESTPGHHARQASAGLLVLANVPFAPAAHDRALPLTSNGGADALAFQKAVFASLRALHAQLAPGVQLHALVMGMCAGDATSGHWALEQAARSALQPLAETQHWAFRPLSSERLLRIDGKRAVQNPAPVEEAMTALARCKLYHPQEQRRAELKRSFATLARGFRAAQQPDFTYGILEVCLSARKGRREAPRKEGVFA